MEQQKKKQGVTFSDVLNEIYTVHDVNIQTKFPELIEFQMPCCWALFFNLIIIRIASNSHSKRRFTDGNIGIGL